MRVWVTRAEPGASATAERLRRLGYEPVVAPLLVVRPVADARIDLAGVEALAFTSANGVAAFAALSPERALPVYAVGEATAATARAAGFSEVTAGASDVAALARLIAEAPSPPALVLHPAATEPAGDLKGWLAAAGVAARAVPVYATLALESLPDLGGAWPEAALLHSPKAARALARLLPPAGAAAMTACALSPACAAPLARLPFKAIWTASTPNEDALLARLPPA